MGWSACRTFRLDYRTDHPRRCCLLDSTLLRSPDAVSFASFPSPSRLGLQMSSKIGASERSKDTLIIRNSMPPSRRPADPCRQFLLDVVRSCHPVYELLSACA